MTRIDVEIFVRCHNEEDWILECLRSLSSQTLIPSCITVIDNKSSDSSISRIRHWVKSAALPSRVVEYDLSGEDYRPGHCLNKFSLRSEATYVAFLSGHCVAANATWLESLYSRISSDPSVAAVYGRQIPTQKSDPRDIRDLLWTFGSEAIESRSNPLFHNANSIVRRSVLEMYPFDESATNIEDRIWADEILRKTSFSIAYEPSAAVYHEHGIHQSGKLGRAQRIANIALSRTDRQLFDPITRNIACIIPVYPDRESKEWESNVNACVDIALRCGVPSENIICSIAMDRSDKIQGEVEVGCRIAYRAFAPEHGMQEILLSVVEEMASSGVFPQDLLVIEPGFSRRSLISMRRLLAAYYSCSSQIAMFKLPLKLHTWKNNRGSFIRIDNYELPRTEHDELVFGARGLGTIVRISQLRRRFWLDGDIVFVEPFDAHEVF